EVEEDPNENPVAVIWAEYQSFPTGERISLNAHDSYDPDGSIETYSWDLDDDGIFETSGASKSIRFDEAGTYRIELVVSDEQNALGFDEMQFEVFDNDAPQAVLTADVLEGMIPLAV